jgi:hypothetical protein
VFRLAPPRPLELFDAANACLKAKGMPALTQSEQDAYTRYYHFYSTTPLADGAEDDSFISDVSADLTTLSLGGRVPPPTEAAPVPSSTTSLPDFGLDDDLFFPFGVNASVESAAAAAAGHHSRKPSNATVSVGDAEFDLLFSGNDVLVNSVLSRSPRGSGPSV